MVKRPAEETRPSHESRRVFIIIRWIMVDDSFRSKQHEVYTRFSGPDRRSWTSKRSVDLGLDESNLPYIPDHTAVFQNSISFVIDNNNGRTVKLIFSWGQNHWTFNEFRHTIAKIKKSVRSARFSKRIHYTIIILCFFAFIRTKLTSHRINKCCGRIG